jgi:hypothetical protein
MTRGAPLKPPGVYARQCKALLCPRTKSSNTTHTRFKLSTVGFRAISGSPPIPPVRMEGETGGQNKSRRTNALLLNETKLPVPNRGRDSFNGRSFLTFWAEESTDGKNVCGFSCGIQYIINASECLIPLLGHDNMF